MSRNIRRKLMNSVYNNLSKENKVKYKGAYDYYMTDNNSSKGGVRDQMKFLEEYTKNQTIINNNNKPIVSESTIQGSKPIVSESTTQGSKPTKPPVAEQTAPQPNNQMAQQSGVPQQDNSTEAQKDTETAKRQNKRKGKKGFVISRESGQGINI